MDRNGKEFLVCDCEGTMALDAKVLAKACGAEKLAINHQLCRQQLEEFQRLAAEGKPLVVACTQEVPLFLEALGEIEGTSDVSFTNIRERAGWSEQGDKAAPKMAALLAEAALDMKPTTVVTMKSEGVLLVIGHNEIALDAAKQMAGRMDVTVLLADDGKGRPEVVPPRLMDVPVFTGVIEAARGHLGTFELSVEGFAAAAPSSRQAVRFGEGSQAGVSECDLILDLRGGTPLFPAPEARDGYFNPDPGNPALVQRALFDIADMVGEFEKPRYVDFDASLCAHARAGLVGCNNCLDACPTGAIEPDGDHVAIDPYVCAGCGSCASVCPTGAATFALPAGNGLLQRLRTLLAAYGEAGGRDPCLLVHDTGFGEQMIDIMARSGRGLPANVLPYAVTKVTQIGLDFLLGAASYGAARILLVLPPKSGEDADGLRGQVELADTILDGLGYGNGRVAILDESDPERMEDRLYGQQPLPAMPRADFTPLGRKRSLMSLALHRLHQGAPRPVDELELDPGAPFGAIDVHLEGCTVCLACVGACPTGALKDNPDRPQLRFQENACVQCGLCKATCPEKVISLVPRLDFSATAQDYRLIKEEDPFECVRCGKPFGVRSSVERMLDKLSGHAMFENEARLNLIKMCDDCRIMAQAEDESLPLA
ncbi:MAG: 4Fe-4S dicluster domain-containing protein, partial [Rhodospirillales bacterium]|nr:4Fe-4S dicluster domain-containing protein [Rhodospirillales bacterium]